MGGRASASLRPTVDARGERMGVEFLDEIVTGLEGEGLTGTVAEGAEAGEGEGEERMRERERNRNRCRGAGDGHLLLFWFFPSEISFINLAESDSKPSCTKNKSK